MWAGLAVAIVVGCGDSGHEGLSAGAGGDGGRGPIATAPQTGPPADLRRENQRPEGHRAVPEPIAAARQALASPGAEDEEPRTVPPPTPEDDAHAASLTAGIDDPTLRDAVRRAAAASLAAARDGRAV